MYRTLKLECEERGESYMYLQAIASLKYISNLMSHITRFRHSPTHDIILNGHHISCMTFTLPKGLPLHIVIYDSYLQFGEYSVFSYGRKGKSESLLRSPIHPHLTEFDY